MSDSANDQRVELDRYDRRATARLAGNPATRLGPDGSAAEAVEVRTPYVVFENYIRRFAGPGVCVLDVCCGDGRYSLVGAACGARVRASDLAPNNVELTLLRAQRAGFPIEGFVANAENIPLPDASIDVVTCAGSLSYVELNRFIPEVIRVLTPKGYFVCVDSLNHNPIYRFNRYLHFRRGERTLSVIQRTPTIRTIASLRAAFPALNETRYFGLLTFAAPLLVRSIGSARTARVIDGADRAFPALGRYAFKFTYCGGKIA